jgi:hypothetical protein
MQLDLFAQPSLRTDAVTVAYNQHPGHEFRVDRGPADLAVERCQLLAQVSQHPHHDWIDPAQQMTCRNALFEIEQVEQLALIARLPTHHWQTSARRKPPTRRNHRSLEFTSPFSTVSARSGTSPYRTEVALR